MSTFLHRFGGLVLGILCGLDRLVLRGKLCPLYAPEGMNIYLAANKVLRKELGAAADSTSVFPLFRGKSSVFLVINGLKRS